MQFCALLGAILENLDGYFNSITDSRIQLSKVDVPLLRFSLRFGRKVADERVILLERAVVAPSLVKMDRKRTVVGQAWYLHLAPTQWTSLENKTVNE